MARRSESSRGSIRKDGGNPPKNFEEAYRLYYRRVYCLVLRMTKNPAVAEDLTHDTFLQLHRKMGSFEGKAQFTTWLHRMTVNIVLMYFRGGAARKSMVMESMTDDSILRDMVGLNDRGAEKRSILDAIALDEALKELPPGYWKVFRLHDIEGYEHEEIARLIDVTVGTSKSQLHKARYKLRRLLERKAVAA